MDIGLLVPVSVPYGTREFVRTLGTQAEASGFHSLWVGEHVVVPEESTSDYPASEDGALPAAVQYGELDPYGTLSYLAGITNTLRLGACTIVPQRNPVYTAKEIANADWLSGGRIDVGVGVGWSREEFEAVAAPFERRGRRCDAYLRVMKACWIEEVASYDDEFYHLPTSLLHPKPIQQPHPPLHILGSTRAALRRVARFGDGFFPMDEGPDELALLLSQLDEDLAGEGRRREEIRISVTPYTRVCDLDLVRRYRDLGVDQVVLFAFVEEADALQGLIDRFAEEIVEPARKL